MIKQQDDNELDPSAAGLAEASVSPADGELPLCPGDASVSTGNVELNGDEVRRPDGTDRGNPRPRRYASARKVRAGCRMGSPRRGEVLGFWTFCPETSGRSTGRRGCAGARELPIPGKSTEARRKFVERALKIDGIRPEAKVAARAAGLDNKQSALLAIASEHSRAAQLAKVQEIATREASRGGASRAPPRSKESASSLTEVGHLKTELAAAVERQRELEEELETARATASRAPAVDASMKGPTDGGHPALSRSLPAVARRSARIRCDQGGMGGCHRLTGCLGRGFAGRPRTLHRGGSCGHRFLGFGGEVGRHRSGHVLCEVLVS